MAFKSDMVRSLEDICVSFIAENFECMVAKCSDCLGSEYFWRFPYSDYHIVARPAEKILLELCKKKIIHKDHWNLFSSKYVDLASVIVQDVVVDIPAFFILRDFNLYNLTAVNIKGINLCDLIYCLNESTLKNLETLNVAKIALPRNKLPVITALSRLENLQSLNISYTEITSACLESLVKLLPRLRFIDISQTKMDSMGFLSELKENLMGLVAHNLFFSHAAVPVELLSKILELRELRILDVSSAGDRFVRRLSAVDDLCFSGALPHLRHFDICGNLFGLTPTDIRYFIKNHPDLKFLGLAAWPSLLESEDIYQLSLSNPRITMLGDKGEDLLLNTLKWNKDRPFYIRTALKNICEESSHITFHPDILDAVLTMMEQKMDHNDIILDASIAVYNVTRGDISAKLPLKSLNRMLYVIATTIERHYDHNQILKYCFLTLQNEFVLLRAKFNYKRCFELVFDTMVKAADVYINFLGLSIVNTLANSVSKYELKEITSNRMYIRQLLIYLVQSCLDESDIRALQAVRDDDMLDYLQVADGTLEGSLILVIFTLWNLTDENPAACHAFIDFGGLVIFAKVLEKISPLEEDFKDPIYSVCVGFLCNLAEVSSIKQCLLIEPLMNFFRQMMAHPNPQISYFAAGIISHLACLSNDVWILNQQYNRAELIQALGEALHNWTAPETVIVNYRSFRPFELLVIDPNSCLEMQLWAVLAVHYVLTGNSSRYVPCLNECHELQRFLLYVASSDVESMCTSAASSKLLLTSIFPIRAVEVEPGVLRCGPVMVPESWRFLCAVHSPCPIGTCSPDIHSSFAVETKLSDETAFLRESDRSSSILPMSEGSATGPTESQKASANLLQHLAVEIIETVLAFEAEDNH